MQVATYGRPGRRPGGAPPEPRCRRVAGPLPCGSLCPPGRGWLVAPGRPTVGRPGLGRPAAIQL